MHVAVIGAGIVGLTTAWYLAKLGVDVTLVDSGEPGSGASGGNGGQLSYDFVAPLADPSVIAKIPSLLWQKQSPLRVRWRCDLDFYRWLAGFMRACNRSSVVNTTELLLKLAHESRALAVDFFEQESATADYRVAGKLVLFRDQPSFNSAQRQVALQAKLGSEQRAVTAEECVAIEPALARDAANIVGAIWTPTEAVVDTAKLCEKLMSALSERGGFRFVRAQVGRVCVTGNSADRLITSIGELRADAYVVAAGTQSKRLLRPLGIHLPIEPLKGYSITVPITQDAAAPSVSITDSAKKIVYARLGNRLRIAGMAELVGHDSSIEQARVDQLSKSALDLFGEFGNFKEISPWVGFRPATPSGVPIFGRSSVAGLYLNVGHGGLGLTLSFASSFWLARALVERMSARSGATEKEGGQTWLQSFQCP
ncbi:MAG: FAD-dependent oxidoreductase [Burkholderiales bacterium]|nr:MAG: FAD-dependent oxidoreductase [Burkholderiales bacterium]